MEMIRFTDPNGRPIYVTPGPGIVVRAPLNVHEFGPYVAAVIVVHGVVHAVQESVPQVLAKIDADEATKAHAAEWYKATEAVLKKGDDAA